MKSRFEGYSFKLNENVTRTKAKFRNRYGIELAGDLYVPKNTEGKLPAIAVAGPFGAVKEQAAGLYADEMASRGFITMAFDPSFIGESSGEVRNLASPDINTEDFSAAVDFLSVQENIDPEKISIIGICGFGGMALNAAAMDTRIKKALGEAYHESGFVCCWEHGEPLKVSYISHAFSDLLKKNNLPHIRFHDIRHSTATALLRSGVSLKVIQEILGHSTMATTANFYLHPDIEEKRKAVNTMSNILKITA